MNHLIIDGFGLLYRSSYAFKNLQTSTGIPSGAMYGFLTSLRSIKLRYPDYRVTIVWDLDSTRKKTIYSDYKANRNAADRPYFGDTISDLKQMFNYIDVSQAEMLGEEADDVAASIVETYKKEDGVIIIYSADKDLLQLVQDGKVIVIRPKSGKYPEKVFDEERVKTDYGVYPKDIACLLAMIGDTSDNIPGVVRVPTKIVAGLCEKYHTPSAIYDGLPSEDLTDFQRQSFNNFKNQAYINYGLTLIRRDLNYESWKGVINVEGVTAILKKYEIKSIAAEKYIDVFCIKPSTIKKSPAFKTFSLFEEL